MLEEIKNEKSFIIRQRKEIAEVLGFETRNKYEILNKDGKPIGFAAEQQKGFFGMFMRQIMGHWRSFDINIYDIDRNIQFYARHPFRFYFQRLEIENSGMKMIGHIEKRFSIFSKKFTVFDENNKVSSEMYAGLFKIWSFPFTRNGKEIAKITKKWGGAVTEIFLDADSFLLEFFDPNLRPEEKATLLCAAVYIDLMYFENNQSSNLKPGNIFNN